MALSAATGRLVCAAGVAVVLASAGGAVANAHDEAPLPIPQCAPAQTLIVAGMPIVIPCPGVTFPSGGSAAA